MEIAAKAEVHFYDEAEAAVFVQNNATLHEQCTAEVSLFVMYALRVMANLGKHQATDALANFLLNARDYIDAIDEMFGGGGVRLIRYPGHPGRRTFACRMHEDGARVDFDFSYTGFSLKGEGLGYYAPESTMVLLRFLAARRPEEFAYRDGLAVAAAECGRCYLNHRLTVTSQSALALEIIRHAREHYASILWATVSPSIDDDPTVIETRANSIGVELSLGKFLNPSHVYNSRVAPEIQRQESDRLRNLSRELSIEFNVPNAEEVTKTLHQGLDTDERDWFYEWIHPLFAELSDLQWPRHQQIDNEFACRRHIGVFQANRATLAATEQGCILSEKRNAFLNWMLRLTVGDSGERAARTELIEPFSEGFTAPSRAKGLLAASLHANLPDVRGLRFIINMFLDTLEYRTLGRIKLAFGFASEAEKLFDSATSHERFCTAAISTYENARCPTFYLIGNESEVAIHGGDNSGRMCRVWTQHERAEEHLKLTSASRSQDRVIEMSARTLHGQLKGMRLRFGVKWVQVDWLNQDENTLIPAEELQQLLAERISQCDESMLGQVMKIGFGR